MKKNCFILISGVLCFMFSLMHLSAINNTCDHVVYNALKSVSGNNLHSKKFSQTWQASFTFLFFGNSTFQVFQGCSDDEKEKACIEIQKKIKRQEIILKAYEDLQLLQFAIESDMSWKEYDNAVFNLAEHIYEGKPYEPGTLTQSQLNKFYTNQYRDPGSSGTFTEMYTDEKGSIYGPDGTLKPDGEPNMIVFYSKYGFILQGNLEIVRNQYIKRYEQITGEKFFEAAFIHEKVHHEQAKTEGFTDSPGQQRRFEMIAYQAGINSLKQALEDLNCFKKYGAIEYNHVISIEYGEFSQTLRVTGVVPFYPEQQTSQGKQPGSLTGSGSVQFSMEWRAENCSGKGNSPNDVMLEGKIITHNGENYIEMKLNEQWCESMPLNVKCDDEQQTVPMPVPPLTKYDSLKFRMKDGTVITKPFSGMGGRGTYCWTLHLYENK